MLSSSVFVSWLFTLNLTIAWRLYSEIYKCQSEMKDKRFSCSGFGLTFLSEGTTNANKNNTILRDYLHNLEHFMVVFSFFLQIDRVCIHRAQEVTEQFDDPKKNNLKLTGPAQHQSQKSVSDLVHILKFIRKRKRQGELRKQRGLEYCQKCGWPSCVWPKRKKWQNGNLYFQYALALWALILPLLLLVKPWCQPAFL